MRSSSLLVLLIATAAGAASNRGVAPQLITVAARSSPAAPAKEPLRERVRRLETEVARLRAMIPQDGLTAVTYGPDSFRARPVRVFTTESGVLAARGVPDRVEWGPERRVLEYGRLRYVFDAGGQLVDARGD